MEVVGDTSVWYEVFHRLCWFWGLWGGVCALPGVIWNDLQSNLQMAATSAGLGGAQRSQAVNQGWLLLVPGLGSLSKKYGAC